MRGTDNLELKCLSSFLANGSDHGCVVSVFKQMGFQTSSLHCGHSGRAVISRERMSCQNGKGATAQEKVTLSKTRPPCEAA